ncbi:MAG: AAA family ATPase [Bacteroidaceae bacterium]|nr:AAA family ATPase [Bacteroidaceae bacterium]
MKKIKFIKRQDSGFKLSYGNSGETSLNLSNEIFDFISKGALSPGEERNVTFRIFKEDCIKAMSFVIMKLPLYKSSSNYSNKVDNYLEIFGELYSKIESFFGSNKEAEYKVSLLYRPDGRIYLKGLRVNGFSIRDYLVENYSALQFDNEGNDILNLRVLSDIEDNGEYDDESQELEDVVSKPLQQIFYGAPGTGKSHEVKKRTGELSNDEERDLPNVFRTTFHPDTDYASFVGCYKPSMRKTGKKHQVDGKDVDDEEIIYEFVPQTFTDAYVYAYKNPTLTTYLVIEEINRGNCAQIFGDLFQLLDRKNGVSEYKIKADKDLAKYLNEELGKDADGIKDGKLCLPANLSILATMNTSDQSLFPMDSAFKRRWEWKYIKIADAHKDWKIETNGEDWYGFICQINRIISNMTSSADKQLGYFFCQANEDGKITTETFVSKVIFYLWNDVFKDYGFEDANLFKYKTLEGDKEVEKDLTFPDFYDEDGNIAPDVVKQFIEHVMAWEKDKKKGNN